jgi:hypothetical protein
MGRGLREGVGNGVWVGGEAVPRRLRVYASVRLVVRDVAQPGSAPEWGSGGRGFKSRRPDSQKRGPGRRLMVGLLLPNHQAGTFLFRRRWRATWSARKTFINDWYGTSRSLATGFVVREAWQRLPSRSLRVAHRSGDVPSRRNGGITCAGGVVVYLRSAHEHLTRQTSRHAAAERPDVASWPAAPVRPSATRNIGELRSTDGVPPVRAGGQCGDQHYPVRQFSVLCDHGDRSSRAWRSSFRFRTRIPHRRLRRLDACPRRPAATAPSSAPSLASPKRSVP